MGNELIKAEDRYDGEVTEISIGPPPANILSAKMMDEISALLKEQAKNSRKKLFIFCGEGKHFSFGASVEEHKPEKVAGMLPVFHRFIGEVISCKIPTLAKVSGMCLGGAFEFALACTFIFADETAKFSVPEIQLGVFPPVASALLPFLSSAQFSSQVILTGDQFTAKELHNRGLVNHVAEKGGLDDVIGAFYEKQLLPKSASSLQITHVACRKALAEHYKNFIGSMEELYLRDLMATQDAVEGITAFLEKRQPEWRNG